MTNKLTEQDVQRHIERLLADLPYETPGQLRDAVDADPGCECCHDWTHPYSSEWVEMQGWLHLAGVDWRAVK